jgi:hypothetical protein
MKKKRVFLKKFTIANLNQDEKNLIKGGQIIPKTFQPKDPCLITVIWTCNPGPCID